MKSRTISFVLIQLLFFNGLLAQKLLTTSTYDDRYPRWSPIGDEIVFESNRDGDWEIYKMKSDGSNLVRLTFNSANDRRPTWHPSKKAILFESDRDGKNQLYLLYLNTQGIEKINIPGISDIIFAEYSPDGSHIAFSSNLNIYTSDASGQDLRQLTFDTTRSIYPIWSPDQLKIAFFSRRDTSGEIDEIYTYTLSNKSTESITEWPTHNFVPNWSPEGTHLVCATSITNSRPELYLINLESKSIQRITQNDFGDTEPHWSPGNNTLVYACQRNGNYDICVKKIDKYLKVDNKR